MVSLHLRIAKRWRKSLDWLKGFFSATITLRYYMWLKKPICDITRFQRRIPFIEKSAYSQNGEDGIIHAIFAKAGTTNKYCVDFGAVDGVVCSNTLYLRKHKKWTGLLMDGQENPSETIVKREFITAENIENLFTKYNVPREFDLISIDIDGNDYWVWKAIRNFKPRVVVIEYNACLPAEPAVTIPYIPDFVWDKTDYYGASLGALVKLGKEKGYTLIGTDNNGVNAFFVLNELAEGNFAPPPYEMLYHPAAFKGRKGNRHPPDPNGRKWVSV